LRHNKFGHILRFLGQTRNATTLFLLTGSEMPGQWARNQLRQSRLRRCEKGPMDFGLQDRVAIIAGTSLGVDCSLLSMMV